MKDTAGLIAVFMAGREFTGMDAIDWAAKCQELGAGEILFNQYGW